MSRVTFNSEHAEAELRGSERAYAGGVVNDIFGGLLRSISRYNIDELLSLIVNAPSYLALSAQGDPVGRGIRFDDTLTLACRAGNDIGFRISGEVCGAWEMALNTAILVGNDVVRLLTRLHAQCEIHGWIPEQHRGWYANLIDDGRRSGLLRGDQGWEAVAALLRNGDGGPVVTDYSVADGFPNPHVAEWTPPRDENDEEDWDAWYDLPDAQRWQLAIDRLTQTQDRVWQPDGWARPYFSTGATSFDLAREVSAVRTEAAT